MTTIDIQGNLRRVRSRIVDAAVRAGRSPREVTLVAVSKFHPAEVVARAVAYGQHDFGENYPQELWAKANTLGPGPARWHLIGHLQRNKITRVLPYAGLIHSIDSLRLIESLDAIGRGRGEPLPVLLEVNVSRELSKHGFVPEELPALGTTVAGAAGLRLEGLMGMAAHHDDPRVSRPAFAELRTLRDRLRGEWGLPLPHLSMGMSADFEVAIEEGATIVRIGTAIFGPRV